MVDTMISSRLRELLRPAAAVIAGMPHAFSEAVTRVRRAPLRVVALYALIAFAWTGLLAYLSGAL